MNIRSLGPDQLQVLLALARLGPATHADVIAAVRCETAGQAAQALRFLINRGLAEAGSFGGGPYGYRLTADGRDCARKAM